MSGGMIWICCEGGGDSRLFAACLDLVDCMFARLACTWPLMVGTDEISSYCDDD